MEEGSRAHEEQEASQPANPSTGGPERPASSEQPIKGHQPAEQANERQAQPGVQPQPEQLTYETAAGRVEEIIRRLDSGEAGLAETLQLVQEGKSLIERCAAELSAVAGALEELRLDELVERLEAEAKR